MTTQKEPIPDVIQILPETPATHLVYFIPGNPGLVAYYQPFLSYLHTELKARYPGEAIALVGRSLAGFEFKDADAPTSLCGLDQQVDHVDRSITRAVKEARANNPSDVKKPLPVTLVGHSLGGYLLLRIIESRLTSRSTPDKAYTIAAGMPLFPAVADLHKSRNAQSFGWLAGVPGVAPSLNLFSGALLTVLPDSALQAVVSRVMGRANAEPGSEEAEAVRLTVAWLRSRAGLRSTLHLGAEEVARIRADTWDAAVWGAERVAEGSKLPPRLLFYFGERDDWIADHTRDDLIRVRAWKPTTGNDDEMKRRWESDSRPYMEIDATGTPHSFCIGHSEKIAKKVAGLMGQVL